MAGGQGTERSLHELTKNPFAVDRKRHQAYTEPMAQSRRAHTTPKPDQCPDHPVFVSHELEIAMAVLLLLYLPVIGFIKHGSAGALSGAIPLLFIGGLTLIQFLWRQIWVNRAKQFEQGQPVLIKLLDRPFCGSRHEGIVVEPNDPRRKVVKVLYHPKDEGAPIEEDIPTSIVYPNPTPGHHAKSHR